MFYFWLLHGYLLIWSRILHRTSSQLCQNCQTQNCQDCYEHNCHNCEPRDCHTCYEQKCTNCEPQNCQTCDVRNCETCEGQNCQSCQVQNCQNCQKPNCQNCEYQNCQNCEGQSCQNCGVQNCQNCQANGQSQKCDNCYNNGYVQNCGNCQTNGYYPNCQNCTYDGHVHNCQQCQPNAYYPNCQNCTNYGDDQHCHNCNLNGDVLYWTENTGDLQNCQSCQHTGDKRPPWWVDRDDRILLDFDHGQVSVSSSAAASVKYPHLGTGGSPHAYISSLSSAKADPEIPVTVVDGVAVERPKRTWGYRDTSDAYGPENWPKIAPKCAGTNQSPINIVTSNAIEKNIESPIAISMDDPTGAALIKGRLINNGKTIGFEVSPNSPPVRFTGEITQGNSFELKQFHLHFGCEGKKGSEHTIDGEKFSGEMHLVFKNEKYANPKVAMQQKDGLAILAFFLQARPNADPNPAFDKIANNIPNIQFAKQQMQLPGGLSIIHLIPPLQDGLVNLKRYVYKGSLPTPPCYESVTWIVFNRAISIQPNKIMELQSYLDGGGRYCGNVRANQPLNGRNIFKFMRRRWIPFTTGRPSSRPSSSSRRQTVTSGPTKDSSKPASTKAAVRLF